MVNQIAVINIKKLAGGTNVGSELSVESGFYLDHISDENEKAALPVRPGRGGVVTEPPFLMMMHCGPA